MREFKADINDIVDEYDKLKKANVKAQSKHNEFQNALIENPIYPADRHDSDAQEFSRPEFTGDGFEDSDFNWQEEQARDIEEMENE